MSTTSKRVSVVIAVVLISALGVALRGVVRDVKRSPVATQTRVRAAGDVQGLWAPIGPLPFVRGNTPAPFSGRIASIAVDPTDYSHWLLGVGFGGVWESRDAGTTWAPLTDGAPTLATGVVTFDPINPQTIYIG